ncbi:MAG: carboxypeptidase-like regulatory domain-containing protein, partial [Bryobacteraceae bacterium]
MNTATVVGAVTDQSAAAVTGVSIVLTNIATGTSRTTLSDSAGYFVLPDLAPGEYTLTAKHAGFRTYLQSGIVLNVDQRPRLEVVLQVGEVTQEVSVTATVPIVESQNANIGGLVDQTMTQQLPLNGRQFLQLATLMPGVSVNAGSQVTGRGAGPRSFGIQLLGSRPTDNTYLIDGVDSFAFKFKNTSVRPAVGSVQEFNVLQNPYDVQYGITSGASVNVI